MKREIENNLKKTKTKTIAISITLLNEEKKYFDTLEQRLK